MLNSQKTHLIETSYDRWNQEKSHLSNTEYFSASFRWVTNIHEHKRYYYTFDNYYYLLSIQNTTQIFPR